MSGDGSVTAYLTPTHSAGSVLHRIQDGGFFALVVGDNGYTESSWEAGVLPGIVYDEANTLACFGWIKRQREKTDYVGVYCAHDPLDR